MFELEEAEYIAITINRKELVFLYKDPEHYRYCGELAAVIEPGIEPDMPIGSPYCIAELRDGRHILYKVPEWSVQGKLARNLRTLAEKYGEDNPRNIIPELSDLQLAEAA